MSGAAHRTQRLAAVLWPSFLIAGAMEMLVFSMVDPGDLHGIGGAAIEMSRQAVYTLGFLAFWAMVSIACSLTALLMTETDASAEERAGA